MPSPFPGMDPFLEDPALFLDFHDSLVTYLREYLQASLPEPYFAATGQRVWIETSRRTIGPDVSVVHTPANSTLRTGGVAVAVPSAGRHVVVHVPHDELRQPFLEIFAGRRQDRRLVTTIEVLSPSNKLPGEQGRELYLRKQRELRAARAHLVEIDLLRAGQHTTSVPLDAAVAQAGAFDYHVCAHRFDRLEDFEFYPIQLDDRLPVISVPLLPEDPAVEVDLQAVFDRCYDAGPYTREIDYRRDPIIPPLRGELLTWVRSLLHRTGDGSTG